MSGETLLSKAAYNLESVQYNLKRLDNGDERVLNLAGYLLQQSAELFLKHFLETESTGYPYTHDIATLIDLVDEADTSAMLTMEFRLIAGSLTDWEAKTRYTKDYLASRNAILDALRIMQDMFAANGVACEIMDVSKYYAGKRGMPTHSPSKNTKTFL